MRLPLPAPAALALLGAVALAACGGDDAPDVTAEADRGVLVDVLVADPGLFEDTIELTGTVEADNDVTLSPDVGGTLTYVAPVGTVVRAGQTVAQVRASQQQAGVSQAQAQAATSEAGIRQAQAQVAGAEAAVAAARAQREAAQSQLDLAEDQYRRQYPLFRDSILSALEFRGVESQRATARAQVAQAEAGIAQAQGQLRAAREGVASAQAQRAAAAAGVQSARTQLGNTRIVAPFSGVIEERLMEPGELAGPGSPVVRLVGSTGVKVTAGVPERYAGDVRPGTTVRVSPNAYAAEPRGGRVTFVGLAVNPQSRTFPIEVAVENADRALKPSMVVRLSVAREVLEGVISVPQAAVERDERGPSVFVAVARDTAGTVAVRRPVELGPSAGDEVVLLSGVEPGDRVIVSGRTGLSEGDRVRIEERRPGGRAPARRETASN